jgi:hypothetical protein
MMTRHSKTESAQSMSKKGIRNRITIGVLGAALGGLLPATAFAATPSGGATSSTSTTAPSTTGPSTTVPIGTGTQSDPRCTPSDLPAAKGYVEGLLKDRVVRLERLTAQVGSARAVTASDKQQLESLLANGLTGIETLQQQVPGDMTCAELVANAETMVFTYRVYAVMTPQTELVVVSDTATGIASSVAGWEPGIQAAINYEAAHGKNVAEAEQALDDLKTQLTDALAALNRVSATVLAQTPSGYPGNHAVFVSAGNSCATAFGDLGHARADLGTILSVLS